jgi:histone H3/H4
MYIELWRGSTYNVIVALREIKAQQESWNLLIPRARFGRLVREILFELGYEEYRVMRTAIEALQEVAEAMVTAEFQGNMVAE